MAKGFINISHSQNGDVRYFAREKECTYVLSSPNLAKGNLLDNWKALEETEKFGNKELGIKGRYDARVRTNYILSMPNELSPPECAYRVKNMVEQTPIEKCSYSIFVHKGEKNGITNQHVHLIVNERFLDSHKKDREMQKKVYLEKTFRPLFYAEFASERSLGKELISRERIKETFFHADLSYSQQSIQDLNQFQLKEKASQEVVPMKKDNESEWNQLFLAYATIAEQNRGEEREKLAQEQLRKQEKETDKKEQDNPNQYRGMSM